MVSSLQEISFEGELDNGATGQLVNLAPATGSPRASLKFKPSTATCLHSMRSGAQLMLYIHPQSPSIKIRTQRRHRWCVAALQRSIMHQDSRLISMIPKQGDRLTAAEEDWLLGNTMAHHHHAHTHAIHDTCMAQPSISNSAYSTRIVIHVPVQKNAKGKIRIWYVMAPLSWQLHCRLRGKRSDVPGRLNWSGCVVHFFA